MGLLEDVANSFCRWVPLLPKERSAGSAAPPDEASTPPRFTLATAKRKIQESVCQQARDAKKSKALQVAAQEQKEVELFGDKVVDMETLSKGELLLQCMKRLDENWTKTKVEELSGITRKTLGNYHEVWGKCAVLPPERFSSKEVQENKEKRLLFHCENNKPGRAYCEPLTKLEIKESVAKIVASGNSQLLSTQTDAFTNAILPNLTKERTEKNLNVLAGSDTIFQRSAAAVRRFIKNVIPVKKDNVKKHVQSRSDARKNPVGAFSFVALFPQLTRNVHISNIVCIDAVTTELFGEANKGAWITEEVDKDLKARRQAPKASDSGGQYRSFKLNLAMALRPESLVSGCGIIADHEIDTISKINITENLDIIFSPYCSKDEEERANINPEADSLSVRVADCIYQSHLKRIMQRRDKMCEWARANGNVDPGVFQLVRILQDGDSGPLKKIMDCFALSERQHNLLFGKLPNNQTNNCQINDMAVTHCMIHSAKDGYSSPSFKSMNEDRVQQAIAIYPGLQAALDKLESYRGMSRLNLFALRSCCLITLTHTRNRNGKLSYRYAIAFLPSLLERAVTPAIVQDAFRVAGYHPYNPAKIMHNMWATFEHLSQAEAEAALEVAEGPLRDLAERRGLVYPIEVNAAITQSEILSAVIDLPEVSPDFDMRRWNMQSTMDLSHAEVQQLHADRIAAAAQAEQERVLVATDKAECARRDKLRFDECVSSSATDERTYKTTWRCKCGGKWSNAITGFKAHETSKSHTDMFPTAGWHGFYAANPAVIVDAVANPAVIVDAA
jgi:hypothetical protein